MKMAIFNLYCEQCRTTTPHKEKGTRATHANPTSDKSVDLTGRTGVAEGRNVAMAPEFMSEMREFTCMRCGTNIMNVGMTPAAPKSEFDSLMRGDDWIPPPEPKG
jgi:hypothetical protein